jgi:hypothetical protein
VFALGLGVGVHHWTPSLPLNTAGTSLKRWTVGQIGTTDGQTEYRLMTEFGIEIETGMDNHTQRDPKENMDNQIKRYAREYGQSDSQAEKTDNKSSSS